MVKFSKISIKMVIILLNTKRYMDNVRTIDENVTESVDI